MFFCNCFQTNFKLLVIYLEEKGIQHKKMLSKNTGIFEYKELEFVVFYENDTGKISFEEKKARFIDFSDAEKIIKDLEKEVTIKKTIRNLRIYKSFIK